MQSHKIIAIKYSWCLSTLTVLVGLLSNALRGCKKTRQNPQFLEQNMYKTWLHTLPHSGGTVHQAENPLTTRQNCYLNFVNNVHCLDWPLWSRLSLKQTPLGPKLCTVWGVWLKESSVTERQVKFSRDQICIRFGKSHVHFKRPSQKDFEE